MITRKARRDLRSCAQELRQFAGDIERVAATGSRLTLPDRIAAADAIIDAGAALFATAAKILRSGEPSDEALKAAALLEKTAVSWRPSAGPS